MAFWLPCLSAACCCHYPDSRLERTPQGFTRLNYVGLAVITGIVGGLLLLFSVEARSSPMSFPIGLFSLLFLSVALGSIGALFFCKRLER